MRGRCREESVGKRTFVDLIPPLSGLHPARLDGGVRVCACVCVREREGGVSGGVSGARWAFFRGMPAPCRACLVHDYLRRGIFHHILTCVCVRVFVCASIITFLWKEGIQPARGVSRKRHLSLN
jgi:hypothetical protein